MANTVDSSSLAPALKRYYTKKRVGNLIFDDAPLLAALPKSTDFVGSVKVVPIRVSEAQLASASVTQAKANSTNSLAVANLGAFHMTVTELHAWATVSHKAMMESRNDAGAFFKAGQIAAEDAMISLKKQLSHGAYRSGWGDIGVIKTISGAKITLTNIDDVVAFYKGGQIQFSASQSSDALRASGGIGYIAAVDRDAGEITLTANVSTLSGVAEGDTIFVAGSRQDSATPTRLMPPGLAAWLPTTAPSSSDSFFNVNRSSDSLLSGVRVTGSISAVEDSLVDLVLALARRGAKPDVIMVSFATYGAIVKNASAQVVRDQKLEAKEAGFSFEAIAINTPKGKVKIVPDYACPDGLAYALQLNTWELCSMGELVGQFNMDGKDSSRLTDSLGIELRYFSYPTLICNAPGFNGVVTLS